MKHGTKCGRMPWVLAAVAGLCAASPTMAQFARAVNPDQSVTAEDAMLRVRELGEAGNTSEALRVLQQVLENDADRMLPVKDEEDPGRFEPVRAACHRLLRGWPELLARYRASEEQNALLQLEAGKHRAVERSRFMTQAGLEAALRVAQEDIEAGRFEAARLRLAECDEHPDGKGPLAKDRARLAVEVARQLGREDVVAWARAMARDAGAAEEGSWPVRQAPARFGVAVTGLDAQAAIDGDSIADRALNSVSPSGDSLTEAILELEAWGGDGGEDPVTQTPDATESAMFGASVGGLVLVNDGRAVACLDAATLGVRWRIMPPSAMPSAVDFEEDWSQPVMGGRAAEPVSSVAAGSGVVVAATKSPGDDLRGGAGSLHGLDINTGRVLWTQNVTGIDPALAGAQFDGPVLIEGDVAIFGVARSGLMRREAELHLVGVDLFRGNVRWVRRVGSVGMQPWLRQESQPESALLDRGVVYRAADLGVLGAYEASTGRPLWVRRLSTARVEELQFRVRSGATTHAYQISTPVADGTTIICHDPTGNKILRVDAANGKLLGSRDASAFGDVQYMLKVGRHLALIGDRHISLVKLDGFEKSIVRMVARFGDAGIVGRCVVSGEHLLVPIAGGVVRVDPSNPDASLTPAKPRDAEDEGGATARETPDFAVARAGNPLVVDLGGGATTLIMAERSLVSTYLRWEKAQEILRVRAMAEPEDPAPLLTMIELGSRASRYDEIPTLGDRVLALADKDPLSRASAQARSRLFELLSEMTRKARRVWQEDGARGAVPPELLSRILGAMGRSAETPEEMVTHAFADAWLQEIRREPSRAIEAYQSVLADARLAQVELDAEDRTDPERVAAPVTSVGMAGPEAARRVLDAIKQSGIAAYAGFEDEARRALEGAGDDATALAAVADRYPGSLAALEGLDRACAAVEREDAMDPRVLGFAARGLELSRAQASAAREEAWPLVAAFLGRVVRTIEDKRPEAALRLVRAVELDKPELSVPGVGSAGASGATSVSSLAQALAERLRTRVAEGKGAAELGGVLRPMAQPLEAWLLAPALIRSATISSRESVLMYSEIEGALALWTRDTAGTRFVAAWTRETSSEDITPIVVTPEETLLLVRPRTDDDTTPAMIECIETATGRVRWKSAALSELMASNDPTPRPRANDRFVTPMDGQVRGADLIAVATGGGGGGAEGGGPDAIVWLVERDGVYAALRVRTGEVIAKGASGVTHVYDVDASDSRVAILGATYRPGVTGVKPRVEVRSAAGALIGAVDSADAVVEAGALRMDLGDHARFARVASNGDVLIGSANGLSLVGSAPASEGGLIERWSRNDETLRSLAGAWMTPDLRTLMALDAQSVVISLDPRTGEATREQPQTVSRIALPLDVTPVRGVNGGADSLAITSANGLVVIGPDGVIIGADGITPKGNLAPAALGATRAACVELFSGMRDLAGEATGQVRVAMLDLPYARVVSTASLIAPGEVTSVAVLDDTLLITAGDSTMVIDAPREEGQD